MGKLITYVGLDVHKETISVALAEAGGRGEVREPGKIANTPAAHSPRLSRRRRRWRLNWLVVGTNYGSVTRRGLAGTASSGN
jgi:hypothetical protein